MQSWSQKGLNMNAIMIMKGTKYDSNLSLKTDHISYMMYHTYIIYDSNPFKKGLTMIAIIEILFSRDLSRNHSHVTRKRILKLQSYTVRFRIEIAYIIPRSSFFIIAIIYGPSHKNYCNHKWPSPI